MRRASFVNDLEYKLVLALNYPEYPVDSESCYFNTMIEYMKRFYDQFDVISDLKNHMMLLGTPEVIGLREFARLSLD